MTSSFALLAGTLRWFYAVWLAVQRDQVVMKLVFFRIPAVITHRGSREKELSERRFRQYLAIIGRGDLSGTKLLNARICSRHFVSGSPADLFDDTNINRLPTRCLGARGRGEKVYQQVVDRHDRHTRRMQAAGVPGQTKSSNRRKGKRGSQRPKRTSWKGTMTAQCSNPAISQASWRRTRTVQCRNPVISQTCLLLTLQS